MPAEYHTRKEEICPHCRVRLLKRCIISGRNKGLYNTCGAKECRSLARKIASNPWVGRPEKHPKWIKDRAQLKPSRMITEERHFIKEMLEAANFKCALTGKKGPLSWHHILPVWKYPEHRFNSETGIVILRVIHQGFHSLFGGKASEQDWYLFTEGGGLYA